VGNQVIHVGDCLPWLRAMADQSVDHVITDPPFEAEAHTLQRRIKRPGWRKSGDDHGNGATFSAPLTFDAMTAELRVSFCEQAARITRRWIIVFGQAEAVGTWRDALEVAGARYKRAGIWVKPGAQPQLSGDRPAMGYESIICAHAPGRSRWNGGGNPLVISCPPAKDHGFGHQTVKPLPVMETLVRRFTDVDDLVCDPFAGTGSTGVAALRLGRRFTGAELDPKHAATAMRRLDGAREQKEMFA
jgi:site-specific DNA-methyltransferase (adenine-specific)